MCKWRKLHEGLRVQFRIEQAVSLLTDGAIEKDQFSGICGSDAVTTGLQPLGFVSRIGDVAIPCRDEVRRPPRLNALTKIDAAINGRCGRH